MICEDVRLDLDAYVDRELNAATADAIRRHLELCPRCGRVVSEREALAHLVRSVPYRPAPEQLRLRVAALASRSRPGRGLVAWAAAAVLLLAVGSTAILVRRAPATDAAVVEEVVNGHVRSLMTNRLFDVESTDQHTVKPWFAGKLDFSPPVADLASIGFPLVGGRVDYLEGRPVAALVYRRQQHTINVFVSPGQEDRTGEMAARSVRGFHVRHWTEAEMSFWAVSDLNDAELDEFARALALRAP